MIRIVLICCTIPAIASLAAAQTRPEPPRQLILSANPLPSPALRLTLLPELRHQEPGDAWPLYQKAAELFGKLPEDAAKGNELLTRAIEWQKLGYGNLPRDEARKVLDIYWEPLALVEKAARCESCNPNLLERVRKEGHDVRIEDVQGMRTAALLLSLRARQELAEGKPEQALRTLQALYRTGRRVGEGPTVICFLVGLALVNVANDTLQEVLTHPRTPNLYWALTNVPRPFLSLRRPLEGERVAAYSSFPGLLEVARDLNAGALSEEQMWKLTQARMLRDMVPEDLVGRLKLASQIQNGQERARNVLVAAGRPRDKVENWPALQLALMEMLLEYDRDLDEWLKWQDFPYHVVKARLGQASRKGQPPAAFSSDKPIFPLGDALLGSLYTIVIAQSRLERQFAALRCVEAVRLYAAAHGGKLPASLADVKEVPLPVCPVSGKSFEYRLQGNTAILSAPEVPREAQARIKPLVYEITIRH